MRNKKLRVLRSVEIQAVLRKRCKHYYRPYLWFDRQIKPGVKCYV